MVSKKKEYINKVIILAYDVKGNVVEEKTLSYDSYYEDGIKLIDNEEYRSKNSIVMVKGKIFNYSGELEQEFENRYSQLGKYIGGKAVYSDGTVIED